MSQYTYNQGGVLRNYYINYPENPSSETGLIFWLHGFEGNGDLTGQNTLSSATNDFVIVSPQALFRTTDEKSGVFWDLGYPSNNVNVLDSDFIRELVQHVSLSETQTEHGQTPFPINTDKIYICGYSNGSSMTYVCAATMSDIFAAFGPVSGFCAEPERQQFWPNRKLPINHIHGTADTVMNLNSPETGYVIPSQFSNTITRSTDIYVSNIIQGGGHVWTFNNEYSAPALISFFSNYKLSELKHDIVTAREQVEGGDTAEVLYYTIEGLVQG